MEIRSLYTERTIYQLLEKVFSIKEKDWLIQIKPNSTYRISNKEDQKVIVKMYNENMQYIGCYIDEGNIIKSPNNKKVKYLSVEYNTSTCLNREQRRHSS